MNTDVVNVSEEVLAEAIKVKQEIKAAEQRLRDLFAGVTVPDDGRKGPRGPMSQATKDKIATARKAAWAKKHAEAAKETSAPAEPVAVAA